MPNHPEPRYQSLHGITNIQRKPKSAAELQELGEAYFRASRAYEEAKLILKTVPVKIISFYTFSRIQVINACELNGCTSIDCKEFTVFVDREQDPPKIEILLNAITQVG